MKSVTFDEEKNIVHQTFVWAFAYREARKSDFQQLMLDRYRFQRRIEKIKTTLDMILESNFRNKIVHERFINL